MPKYELHKSKVKPGLVPLFAKGLVHVDALIIDSAARSSYLLDFNLQLRP